METNSAATIDPDGRLNFSAYCLFRYLCGHHRADMRPSDGDLAREDLDRSVLYPGDGRNIMEITYNRVCPACIYAGRVPG